MPDPHRGPEGEQDGRRDRGDDHRAARRRPLAGEEALCARGRGDGEQETRGADELLGIAEQGEAGDEMSGEPLDGRRRSQRRQEQEGSPREQGWPAEGSEDQRRHAERDRVGEGDMRLAREVLRVGRIGRARPRQLRRVVESPGQREPGEAARVEGEEPRRPLQSLRVP